MVTVYATETEASGVIQVGFVGNPVSAWLCLSSFAFFFSSCTLAVESGFGGGLFKRRSIGLDLATPVLDLSNAVALFSFANESYHNFQ